MSTGMRKLQLTIVSQERKLLEEEVMSVTAVTSEGEVTILPGHIPLVSRLITGELTYLTAEGPLSVVISKGFMTVAPNNKITIMADTAVHAREISEKEAQAAIQAAHETLRVSVDQRERIMAEAALRRALLEIKVAERSRKNRL